MIFVTRKILLFSAHNFTNICFRFTLQSHQFINIIQNNKCIRPKKAYKIFFADF